MYLDSGDKIECFGCEACAQICGKQAVSIKEDLEGFRYPAIDDSLCVNCNLCRAVCPYEHMPKKNDGEKYAFGGYHKNERIRFNSTSGGAFSALVEAFCDINYVIIGAEAKGLDVFHNYVTDKTKLSRFRKSKYSQSVVGLSYRRTKEFLEEGKKVLFSGTPCQIAGLLSFLEATKTDRTGLFTVEVVCEGVPSPLYVRKLNKAIEKKEGSPIKVLDYRFTGKGFFPRGEKVLKKEGRPGKWDFEVMRIKTVNNKVLVKDRWFNPFWSIWLQHLMSRPSCYNCPFATRGRVADITLGDLWGVHLFCPELYGDNGGSSIVVCNTEKGREVFQRAQKRMHGHELKFEDVLKYQSPMRKTIEKNPNRSMFMSELESDMDFHLLNKRWAKRPSFKLLWQKYIWGNRQKVFCWIVKQKLTNWGKKVC